ncbi:hypothetical protein PG994_005235 [Apiospora phragmitis]|uniref:Uncharacterized protein n=1 Tax=Apiospora phragmitis TaxID=2905665 RepID=A0ABR1VSW3_9PEZI
MAFPTKKDVDYFRESPKPTEKPDPKDVDYFDTAKLTSQGSELKMSESSVGQPKLFSAEFTFQELMTQFRAFLAKVAEAKLKAADDIICFTIHDLLTLYSDYIAFIETVTKNSQFAAQLADGISYYSSTIDYNRLIKESFGIDDDDSEAGKLYFSTDNVVKSPEEYNKHKDLISSMVQSLGLFEEVFTIFAEPSARGGVFTTDRRVWLPKLKKAYKKLNSPIFSHDNTAIFDHMSMISKLIADNQPASADAWDGGNLKGNEAFDANFAEFKSLPSRAPKNDTQRKDLLRSSARLLREACSDLQLDWKAVDIGWKTLVDPAQRPTYTRCHFKSPAFAAGKGTAGTPGHVRGILQAGSASTAKANTSKRRTAGGAEEEAPTYAAGASEAAKAKRATITRRTPLLPYRDATARDYKKDFATIVRGMSRGELRLQPRATSTTSPLDEPGPPQVLGELETLIGRARAEVQTWRGRTEAKALKAQRLAAFKLVYLCALAVRRAAGIAAMPGTPLGNETDPEGVWAVGGGWHRLDMHEQRVLRLEDWITHEQAWNEADDYVTRRYAGDAVAREAEARIRRRDKSIASWTRQIEAGRARVRELEMARGGKAAS